MRQISPLLILPLIRKRLPDHKSWLKWSRVSWRSTREVAGFISAVTIIFAACVWLARQWPDSRDWRKVENARLDTLRSTHLMDAIHEKFGLPVNRRFGPENTAVEYFH